MTRVLGDRYELQEQIGGGGMALVYRALDLLLGRTVAVKMLRSQYVGDDEFVARFRQEAQSAARLSHPNIVNIYDVGISNHEYYIVMEYVDGPTLKDVIRDRGPLSVEETVNITGQICDALGHAHNHHIIHRDVKPHNILLTQSGLVKVTDFGIARAMTGNTITHQPGSSVLGSVHYFSPEQARGGATDIKSDIYSLGIVLYEMITQQLPFSGDTPVSVALKHLRDRFIEPRQLNASIPQSVENIVLRCLVKSPDARYPDMGAVKADLQEALQRPNVAKFIMPEDFSDATISIPAVGGATFAELRESHQPRSRKRTLGRFLLWAGVGILVLCVGAFAAYYIVMDLIQVPNLNLPNVVGDTEQKAISTLRTAGFTQNLIDEQFVANGKPKGTVYQQDPIGPTQVKQTRQVTLYISKGAPQISIPNLQGVPEAQAKQELLNYGFSSNHIVVQSVQSSQVNAGSVVNTVPSSGTSTGIDGQVTLEVSSGTAQTTIPNVIGLTLNQATQALLGANLKVGQIYREPFNVTDQTVFRIEPFTADQSVASGSAVDLYVADNSGESGGANTNNTPSTSNTVNNLPPDTHVKQVNIKVSDPSGQPTHVQIYQTDASETHKLVVDEMITASKTWTLTLYLTPQTSGDIVVLADGKQINEKQVPY